MNSYNELWNMIKEECESLVSETVYKTWFSDMKLVSFDEEKAVVSVTALQKKFIEARLFDKLKQSFFNVIGFDIEIELVCENTAENSQVNQTQGYDQDGKIETFDTFVVGSSNRFAHAAAIAATKEPGGSNNPLFIYGDSGLGKTHLLRAIKYELERTHPEMNVVYTSGEAFTNELIHYLSIKNMQQFHQIYRSADVLLVDDIQFISGKERTQEEFFHTFDAVAAAGNQIVLTSDVPPRMIEPLDERLRTRFEWGIMADIQPPDLETRIAILRQSAHQNNLNVSDDVILYIAQRLKENIRQLEGAIRRMSAYVSMQFLPASTTTAQIAIKDVMVENKPKAITPEIIINEVARTYGVSSDDIRSKRQDAETVEMRQMAMYLVRELTTLSTNAIGQKFGGKNHTTVLYNINQFKEKLSNRSDLKERVKDITRNVTSK